MGPEPTARAYLSCAFVDSSIAAQRLCYAARIISNATHEPNAMAIP